MGAENIVIPTNPRKFSKEVFAGERIVDGGYMDKVVKVANLINADMLGSSSANLGKATLAVFTEIGSSFLHADRLISESEAKPGDAGVKESISILAGAVLVAAENGRDPALTEALNSGSCDRLREQLPDPLKGIEREVRNIYITSPDIRAILDQLDQLDEEFDSIRDQETMLRSAGKRINGLSGTGKDFDREKNLVKAAIRRKIESLNKAGRNSADEGIGEKLDVLVEKVGVMSEDKSGVEAMSAAAESMMDLVDELADKGEKEMKFETVRSMLDYIDMSGVRSDDISLNSRLKKALMDVALGIKDVTGLPKGIDKATLAEEIKLRLVLNDCYLLASADGARSLEGVQRFLQQTRADDLDHTLDSRMVDFFLCKGSNGIPTDLAWDKRQDGHWKYKDLLLRAVSNKLVLEKYPELSTGAGKNDFLNIGGPAMVRNDNYGIDRDYYINLRCDGNARRKEIVRELMVVEIMEERKVERKIAEKAVEQAMKLSVATFTESAANYLFVDGDDVAEIHHLKFVRYQDGVETDGSKPPKNKPVGSIHTIRVFDSLMAPMMAYAQRPGSDRGRCKPIYAKDLDPRQINSKSDLQYILGPILQKKAASVKMLLTTDLSPKDGTSITFLQKTYEQLNKVMAETARAGWDMINPGEYDSGLSLRDKQRLLRTWFIAGMMERATESPSLGWNRSALYELQRSLFGRGTFVDEAGSQGDVFITKEDWDWIDRSFSVKKILAQFEADERRAKRYIFK